MIRRRSLLPDGRERIEYLGSGPIRRDKEQKEEQEGRNTGMRGRGTVLVTGACGRVGRHLVPLLCAQGLEVAAVDRKPWGGPWLSGVRVYRGDAGDGPFLDAVGEEVRPNAVVHLAGPPWGGAGLGPLEVYGAVLEVGLRLLRRAVRWRAVWVGASTALVYGPGAASPITLGSATVPTHAAGKAALALEEAVGVAMAAEGLPWACLRLFLVAEEEELSQAPPPHVERLLDRMDPPEAARAFAGALQRCWQGESLGALPLARGKPTPVHLQAKWGQAYPGALWGDGDAYRRLVGKEEGPSRDGSGKTVG